MKLLDPNFSSPANTRPWVARPALSSSPFELCTIKLPSVYREYHQSRERPLPLRSLNHLIRALQQRLGNRQADRLCGLHVDAQLELGRPLDRHIGRLGALENAIHVVGDTALDIPSDRTVGHEQAEFHQRS